MSAYTQVPRLLEAMPLEADTVALRESLGDLIVRVSGEFDRVLGFDFDGDTQTRAVRSDGLSEVYLPAPGAGDVQMVVENGTLLDPGQYERERGMGRYLTRLDGNGGPSRWAAGSRAVSVTYTPNPPPPELEQFCIQECIRAWQGRQTGYPDLVGVAGSNERQYVKAFAPGTLDGLKAIRAQYGAVNVTSI